MSEETELDRLFPDMEASDTGRLRFFAALADTELFLLLEREVDGDQIEPRLFAVEEGQVVLAFDLEERLSAFAKETAAYVALPGRIVAQLLADQGIGLGLNLDVAPSSTLLSPQSLTWLTETLGANTPDEAEARLKEVAAPGKVPEMLLEALGARLSQAVGLAECALLAGVVYDDGGRGHMLAFVGAEQRAEAALARMVSEALTFSGVEAGFLDVAFLPAGSPVQGRMSGLALRFDIPQPETAPEPVRAAPGSDPSKPPKLR